MAPVKISDRPDTFAGFDIVVSISEEAVNGQLARLYDTPLSTQRLIPPSKLKSFKPLPPSEYLINHNLSLHLINKKASTPDKVVYRKTGIECFIECPKVRFRPEEYDDMSGNAFEKYKKAYLEVKFKRNQVKSLDSIMTYYDQDSEQNESITLNGCTMVWAVKIGRKDVGDVLKDIIEPARDPSNPTATSTEVTKKLEKYVDSNIFTVSTIFCLFEEKSMTDSFLLLDPQRKPIRGAVLSDVRHHVTLFFSEMTDEWKENQGTPYATTENPYILGYGISQKITSEGGSGASSANTPDYFKPKQVAMSITPGEVRPEWLCTSGSLNYCLLTHRDSTEGHELVDIDEADLNAGIVTKNFFDLTKTMGRTPDPQGAIQGHDGIMGFSKGIFSGLWLRSILPKLFVDLKGDGFKDMLAKGLKIETKDLTVDLGQWNEPTASGNGWEMKRAWKTGMMEPPEHAGSLRVFIIGDHRVKITYNSDTSSINSVQDGITHTRRIFFDIESETKWDYVLQHSSGLINIFKDPAESNNWLKERLRGFGESEYLAENRFGFLNAWALLTRTKSFVRVVMHSGNAGTWNVDVDEGTSKNLFKKDTKLEWTRGDVDNDTYGNFQEVKNFYGHTADDSIGWIQNALTGWGSSAKDIVGDAVQDAFKGLTTTVIMPAGDVFTFAGLDTDESGNVYAQVNFANDGGFKVIKGKPNA